VLLLLLCNDEQLLGPLTNGRLLNAIGGTAVVVILALSTMLTITNVLPHVGIAVALLATTAMLLAGGSTLVASIMLMVVLLTLRLTGLLPT